MRERIDRCPILTIDAVEMGYVVVDAPYPHSHRRIQRERRGREQHEFKRIEPRCHDDEQQRRIRAGAVGESKAEKMRAPDLGRWTLLLERDGDSDRSGVREKVGDRYRRRGQNQPARRQRLRPRDVDEGAQHRTGRCHGQ